MTAVAARSKATARGKRPSRPQKLPEGYLSRAAVRKRLDVKDEGLDYYIEEQGFPEPDSEHGGFARKDVERWVEPFSDVFVHRLKQVCHLKDGPLRETLNRVVEECRIVKQVSTRRAELPDQQKALRRFQRLLHHAQKVWNTIPERDRPSAIRALPKPGEDHTITRHLREIIGEVYEEIEHYKRGRGHPHKGAMPDADYYTEPLQTMVCVLKSYWDEHEKREFGHRMWSSKGRMMKSDALRLVYHCGKRLEPKLTWEGAAYLVRHVDKYWYFRAPYELPV